MPLNDVWNHKQKDSAGFSAGPALDRRESGAGGLPGAPRGHTYAGAEREIPLEALIRRNRKLLFDSSALASEGFRRLVGSHLELLKTTRNQLFVPDFELSLLSQTVRADLEILFQRGILTLLQYQGVEGYPELLPKIAVMGREKGQLCVVLNRPDKQGLVFRGARSAGIFVQVFSLDSKGNLLQGVRHTEAEMTQTVPAGERPQHQEPKPGFTISSTPERMKITPIRIARALGKGDVLYDSKKQPVTLQDPMIVNPNAVTYSTDIPGVWAKIYHPAALTNFLEEKAKRMLSREVRYPGLCWPTDLVRDGEGNFVGVLLPPAKGEPLQLAVFKQAKLETYFPDWDKKDLCDLTLAILRVIKYLHSMNILMGCINPAAIRVAGKDEVYFVDTDNYQIEGFPSLVYNVSFTPPELQGRKIYLCSKENENYAVAVLVFMLMMPGKTPYTLSGDKTIAQAIQERNFPFPNGTAHGSHAMPGMWRFMWSHLTPFKDAFYNTFQKGGKYELPEQRRTVGNWIGTVLRFREELEHPTDPESLKLYPQTFKRVKNEAFYTCRFCGVSHPRFYFNSRYFDDYQICNGCLDKRSNVSFTCQVCGKTYFYTNRTALYHAMMKKKDAEWKDQKYCRDCKNKTLRCIDCGEEKPYFFLRNGRCKECNERHRNEIYRMVRCRDCGTPFAITVGEHAFSLEKGFSDPVRCKSCRARKRSGGF